MSTQLDLDVSGRRIVKAYRNAFAVEVKFDGDDEVGIKIEERYVVSRPSEVHRMDPAADDDDRVALCFAPLIGVVVDKAIARETGELRVEFVDGSTLDCGPGGKYEPWAFYGPRRMQVWSLPGGRITVVDPE